MADYTLVYLNYRGRAELIRFIFAQTGIKYEDTRIDPAKWAEKRADTQYGVLPYFEIKSAEKTISGNSSIARYLAEKYGLGGESDLDNASMSSIVEVCEDVWSRINSIYWLKDEAMKTKGKKMLMEKYLPVILTKLEAQIVKNNSDSGWICTNSKVSYADFAVYVLLECLTSEMSSPLSDTFPHLAHLMESVQGLERIKEWMKFRPDTEH